MTVYTRSSQEIPSVLALRRWLTASMTANRAPSVLDFNRCRPDGWATAQHIINHYGCNVPRGEAHSWAKLLGTMGLEYDPRRGRRIGNVKQSTQTG